MTTAREKVRTGRERRWGRKRGEEGEKNFYFLIILLLFLNDKSFSSHIMLN